MKKHNIDPAYGDDGAARTGLMLSMGEVPPPLPLAPEDVIWPEGYAAHYGVHQMDRVVQPKDSLTLTERVA